MYRYGLRAELIDAQAANPGAPLFDEFSNTILDPRRILNEDELPQFIDYADNKGNNKKKVAVGKGDIAQEPSHPNRTCLTVHMIWSLDGFKWGDQIILPQIKLTDDLAIEAGAVFTNEIHESQLVSTYLLVSPTEKGVQTGDTLAERMDMLHREVTARGLSRPIIILTDGHKSRFSHKVLTKCREYNFRMYVERSNSSQFLQALDQFNKKFHNQYNKAKKNYKKEAAVMLASETGKTHTSGDIKLTKIDFLKIFSRISLDWSTAEDRRTAFRVVGILQNALDPSEICRKAFIVQPESPKAPTITFGPIPSPENVRRNSAEYWKAKFLACDERRVSLESLHVKPRELGLLNVPQFTASGKKRKRNFTDKHGSLDMQQMLELREEADALEEADRERRDENVRTRQERADQAYQLQVDTIDAFFLCHNDGVWECKCATTPCPQLNKKHCTYCNKVKSRVCMTAACKRARLAHAQSSVGSPPVATRSHAATSGPASVPASGPSGVGSSGAGPSGVGPSSGAGPSGLREILVSSEDSSGKGESGDSSATESEE